MRTPSVFAGWLILLCGVGSWIAVVVLAVGLTNGTTAYVARLQEAQHAMALNGSSARIHALAQDTALDRAQIDRSLTVDVVSTAVLLQHIGRTTGATVKLSDATQEPVLTAGSAKLQPIGFLVQADGSFSSLMRTVQILSKLPLASSIERIRLNVGKAEGKGSTPWHLELYLRVLMNPTTGV